MWNAGGELQDTKAVIPTATMPGIYQVVIDDCKAHGASTRRRWAACPTSG